uniref:hypothetical protein n=1 Tax=Flavobacterium sp. TaxID=239 RepID=UPI00404B7C0D
MRKIISFFSALTILILCSSNVSQPGIYSGGGTAFSMLFPEDSLAYKKVQMQEEAIYMQLYKGYAVVKGTYKMVNTSSEKLSFRMGYPIHGIYNGGNAYLNQVSLDSIYKFKVKSNQKEVKILESGFEDTEQVMTFKNDNWLLWNMDFLPKTTNYIEVYFIVNTNNAGITKGYSHENHNAFIYLLESGKVWKQPIEKGKFVVELKDHLKLDMVQGISEHFGFKKVPNKEILIGNKTKFSPTPEDNLIITYGETIENFNFETVLKQEATLYHSIDILSKTVLNNQLEDYTSKNPYNIQTDIWAYFPMVLTLAVIYLPIFLIGIIVFIIFRLLYKKFKR